MGQEQSRPAGGKGFKPPMMKRKKKRKEVKSSLLKDQKKEYPYQLSPLGGSLGQNENKFEEGNNIDSNLSQHPPKDDINFLSDSKNDRNQNEGSNKKRYAEGMNSANVEGSMERTKETDQKLSGIEHSTITSKIACEETSEKVFSMPEISEFALVPYVPPNGDGKSHNNNSYIINDFTSDLQNVDKKQNYVDPASLSSKSSSRDSILEEMQHFVEVQADQRPGSGNSKESTGRNRDSERSKNTPNSAFNLDISSDEEEGGSISSSTSGGGYSYSSKERKQIDEMIGFMQNNPPPPDSVSSVNVDTTSESSNTTSPKSDASISTSPKNFSSSNDEDLFVLSELKTLSNSIKSTNPYREKNKVTSPSRRPHKNTTSVDLGFKSHFPSINVDKMISSFDEELIEKHRDRSMNEKRWPHKENNFLPKFDAAKAIPIYHDDEIQINTKSQSHDDDDVYSSDSGSEGYHEERRSGNAIPSSFKVDSGSDSESPGGFMFSIDRLDLAKEEIHVDSTGISEESKYGEREDGFVTAINKVIRAQRDIVSNEDKPKIIPESQIPDFLLKSKSYTDPTRKAVAVVTDRRGRERDTRRHQPPFHSSNRIPVATSRAERRRLRSKSPQVTVGKEEHEVVVNSIQKSQPSPIVPTRRDRRARRYRSASPSLHERPSSSSQRSRITIDESYSSEDQYREANRNEEIKLTESGPQRRLRKDITELRSRARASRIASATPPSTEVFSTNENHKDDRNPYLIARRKAYMRDSSPNNRTNSSTFRRNNELIARLKKEKSSKRKMILPETIEDVEKPVTESADEMIARLKILSGNNDKSYDPE